MTELKVGDRAPDFDLPTDTGRVSLAGLKGKNVVLYFYPKDDTAGCTSQALQFSSEVEEFAKLGAVIIGVSKDSAASHAKFRKKHDLTSCVERHAGAKPSLQPKNGVSVATLLSILLPFHTSTCGAAWASRWAAASMPSTA